MRVPAILNGAEISCFDLGCDLCSKNVQSVGNCVGLPCDGELDVIDFRWWWGLCGVVKLPSLYFAVYSCNSVVATLV